jgi:hypothetical protein
MSGKVSPWFARRFINSAKEEGDLTSSVFGFTSSGNNCNTSYFDSPIIPPVRILGLEAEK